MAHESSITGLVQTGMGLASLGLLATGQYFDVSSADAIYLGSTAAWELIMVH